MLQLLQWQQLLGCNINELISQKQATWAQYNLQKHNRIFLTHQMVCNCILESEDGGNHFKLRHIKKDCMEREEKLPKNLPVSASALLAFERI